MPTTTPIKILVAADTAEAAAAMQAFINTTQGGLKSLVPAAAEGGKELTKLRETAMATHEGFRTLSSSVMLLGGAKFPELSMGVMALTEGMRGLRSVAMLTGASLTSMLPVVGAVAAAVGAGALVWHSFESAQARIITRNNELTESFQKQAETIKLVNEAAKGGAITKEEQTALLQRLGLNVGGKPDFTANLQPPGNNLSGMNAQPPLHLDLSPTGLPDAMAIGQVNAELARLGVLLKTVGKDGQTTYSVNPEIAALAELTHKREAYESQMAVGFDKQRTRAGQEHAEEMRNLDVEIAKAEQYRKQLEFNIRNISDPRVKKVGEDEIAQLSPEKLADSRVAAEEAYQAKMADIDAREAAEKQRKLDEQNRKQAEAVAKAEEEKRKLVEQQDKEMNAAVEDYANATTNKTKGFWDQVYAAKYSNAKDELDRELITQADFDKKVADAQKEHLAGYKEVTHELEKEAQLKQEIARAETAAKLEQIQGSPFLTANEKQEQSIPLWQQQSLENAKRMAELQEIGSNPKTSTAERIEAEKQYYDLKVKEAQLENQISKAQHPWAATFADLKSQAQITMATLASTFKSVFDSAVSSISSGITGLIEGTKTWGQALRDIYNSIVNEIVSAIVQMGVRWLLTQALMAVGGRAIMASAIAATAPMAAMQSLIWATPATLATTATFGAAAIAAPGLIAAADIETMGLSAFAKGGRPEVGQLALVGEKGPELFVPDTAGTVMTAEKTSSLLSGRSGGGAAVASGSNQNTVSVHTWMDSRQMADALEKDSAHEQYVVDVMRKNIHKFR